MPNKNDQDELKNNKDDFNIGDEFEDYEGMFGDINIDTDIHRRKPTGRAREALKFVGVPGMVGVGKGLASAIASNTPGDDITVDVKNIIEESKDISKTFTTKMRPVIIDFRRNAAKALPLAKNIIPRELYKILNKKLSKHKDEKAASDLELKTNQEQEIIVSTINNVFNKEREIEKQIQYDESMNRIYDLTVDKMRYDTNITLYSKIYGQLKYQSSFVSNTFSAYIKKKLELDYKQLFTSRDILSAVTNIMKITDVKLEEIKHNVSLPEINKTSNYEMLTKTGKQQLALKTTNWIGDTSKKMFNVLKDTSKNITDITREANDRFGDLLTVLETSKDAEGKIDPGVINSLKSMIMNTAGTLVGSKLGKKIIDKQKNLKYSLDNTNVGIIERLGLKASNTRSKWEQGNIFKRLAAQVLPNNKSKPVIVDKNLFKRATEPTSYDVASRQSLVEIIPGWLGRIERNTRAALTGKDEGELVYDITTRKFSTTEELKENVLTKAFGKKEFRNRPNARAAGVLKGAYTASYGSKSIPTFEEYEEDVKKLMMNLAHLGSGFRVPEFEKIVKDPNYTSKYINAAFKGLENPVGTTMLIMRSLLGSKDEINKDLVQSLDNELITMMKLERYKDVLPSLLDNMGYSRYFSDLVDDKGIISREAIMKEQGKSPEGAESDITNKVAKKTEAILRAQKKSRPRTKKSSTGTKTEAKTKPTPTPKKDKNTTSEEDKHRSEFVDNLKSGKYNINPSKKPASIPKERQSTTVGENISNIAADVKTIVSKIGTNNIVTDQIIVKTSKSSDVFSTANNDNKITRPLGNKPTFSKKKKPSFGMKDEKDFKNKIKISLSDMKSMGPSLGKMKPMKSSLGSITGMGPSLGKMKPMKSSLGSITGMGPSLSKVKQIGPSKEDIVVKANQKPSTFKDTILKNLKTAELLKDSKIPFTNKVPYIINIDDVDKKESKKSEERNDTLNKIFKTSQDSGKEQKETVDVLNNIFKKLVKMDTPMFGDIDNDKDRDNSSRDIMQRNALKRKARRVQKNIGSSSLSLQALGLQHEFDSSTGSPIPREPEHGGGYFDTVVDLIGGGAVMGGLGWLGKKIGLLPKEGLGKAAANKAKGLAKKGMDAAMGSKKMTAAMAKKGAQEAARKAGEKAAAKEVRKALKRGLSKKAARLAGRKAAEKAARGVAKKFLISVGFKGLLKAIPIAKIAGAAIGAVQGLFMGDEELSEYSQEVENRGFFGNLASIVLDPTEAGKVIGATVNTGSRLAGTLMSNQGAEVRFQRESQKVRDIHFKKLKELGASQEVLNEFNNIKDFYESNSFYTEYVNEETKKRIARNKPSSGKLTKPNQYIDEKDLSDTKQLKVVYYAKTNNPRSLDAAKAKCKMNMLAKAKELNLNQQDVINGIKYVKGTDFETKRNYYEAIYNIPKSYIEQGINMATGLKNKGLEIGEDYYNASLPFINNQVANAKQVVIQGGDYIGQGVDTATDLTNKGIDISKAYYAATIPIIAKQITNTKQAISQGINQGMTTGKEYYDQSKPFINEQIANTKQAISQGINQGMTTGKEYYDQSKPFINEQIANTKQAISQGINQGMTTGKEYYDQSKPFINEQIANTKQAISQGINQGMTTGKEYYDQSKPFINEQIANTKQAISQGINQGMTTGKEYYDQSKPFINEQIANTKQAISQGINQGMTTGKEYYDQSKPFINEQIANTKQALTEGGEYIKQSYEDGVNNAKKNISGTKQALINTGEYIMEDIGINKFLGRPSPKKEKVKRNKPKTLQERYPISNITHASTRNFHILGSTIIGSYEKAGMKYIKLQNGSNIILNTLGGEDLKIATSYLQLAKNTTNKKPAFKPNALSATIDNHIENYIEEPKYNTDYAAILASKAKNMSKSSGAFKSPIKKSSVNEQILTNGETNNIAISETPRVIKETSSTQVEATNKLGVKLDIIAEGIQQMVGNTGELKDINTNLQKNNSPIVVNNDNGISEVPPVSIPQPLLNNKVIQYN